MVPAASSSLAATFYLPLRARASAELEREYFARAAAAESAREEETAAATVLAASWRGKAWRDQLLSLHAWALIIARCSRGFLHRQRARLELRQRSLQWQRLVFDACASVVQKHFRAFNSRKHRHDFYARKAYLASVVQKGEEAVRFAAEQLQQETEKRRLAEDEKARAQVDYLACKLHHLRSTETVPSIYASPYHEGFHPTAFGVPVEQRLRETIKPTLRAEIRAKQRCATANVNTHWHASDAPCSMPQDCAATGVVATYRASAQTAGSHASPSPPPAGRRNQLCAVLHR